MRKELKIIIGILIVVTALWGYHYEPQYMYQLTFVSNFSCGMLLLIDGLLNWLKQKELPNILYQFVLPCTNVVFCTVFFEIFGLHDFNFEGMFFFMHVLNPPVFLLIYLFCTNLRLKNKKDYIRRIFIAPIMMMLYMVFDLVRYFITGELVYGLISTDKITVVSVPLIGVCLYLLMAFMSYGLIELKRFVEKRTSQQ